MGGATACWATGAYYRYPLREYARRGVFSNAMPATCRPESQPGPSSIGTHLPVTVWFLAMHLLTQGGQSISVMELKRLLLVSYETARKVKQKLVHGDARRGERPRPLGPGGGGRRLLGWGASRWNHRPMGPWECVSLATVQIAPDGAPDGRKMSYVKSTRVRNFKGRTERSWAKPSPAMAYHVLTDSMAEFRRLRTFVKHHCIKVMPGGWRSTKQPAFAWANTILSNQKASLLGVCRWVSVKAPCYLRSSSGASTAASTFRPSFNVCSMPPFLHPPSPTTFCFWQSEAANQVRNL